MSVLNNLNNRIRINSDNFYDHTNAQTKLNTLQTRLNARGGPDQWIRMRQDKLNSLKKALLYSYQSAIVQKYDVKNNTKANSIIQLITRLQDQQILNDAEKQLLTQLEQEYNITHARDDLEYIQDLKNIVDQLTNASPLFRCLINHDKLKVDYEDKILSIPFEEAPLGSEEIQETGFHNGTVFKWVHGNKEEWTPDTYWIVYMQYSEETAYFRAEIRKADQEIEIVTIDAEGNESTVSYRGWMTGPNETTALWNTKKNVTWNDMNYTKILYITKDEDTLAFFQRFDRIIINGKPWEVQAYNESYSTNKGVDADTGIIRVALKETYTSTDQFIRETLQAEKQQNEKQNQYDLTHTDSRIDGPTIAKPYDILTFVAKNFTIERDENGNQIQSTWSISNSKLAKIIDISEDNLTAKVEIISDVSNKNGFDINYGNSDSTKVHVVIESL